MPIKDPDKKRQYEKEWRRRERADKRLGKIAKPQRKPVAGVAVPASVLTPDLTTWIDQKASIARELIDKGRGVLLSAECALTAKDALDLLKEGARILDCLAAQSAQEQQSIPVDLAGILNDPAALAAAMELLPYAAIPDGGGTIPEPHSGDATGAGAPQADPGALRDVCQPGDLGPVPAPDDPTGGPAPRRKRRSRSPAD